MDLGWGSLGIVTLGLTYRCNLRCSMCGTWRKGIERSREELTTEEISRILDEAHALGARELILVGAEPLTREDLTDIVRNAKRRGFPVHVVTNGTLLTPALASELVSAGLDRVTFSIDGPPEIHDEVRGRTGAFRLAAQGVRNLRAARDKTGSSMPLIGMHCTISSTNADSITDVQEVAEDLGIKSLSYQLISESLKGDVSSSRVRDEVAAGPEFIPSGDSLLPSRAQAESIRDFARAQSRRDASPSLLYLAAMTPEAIAAGRFPVRRCTVVGRELIVDPYGVVMPCSHLDDYPLGDLRKQSVRQIWEGERRARLRRALKRQLLPICARCCHHVSNLSLRRKIALYLSGRLRGTASTGQYHA